MEKYKNSEEAKGNKNKIKYNKTSNTSTVHTVPQEAKNKKTCIHILWCKKLLPLKKRNNLVW